MDKLVEIPLDDLIALREKYRLRLADQGLGFFVLNNYIKWLQQDPNMGNFHTYSLNGDWSDGTFVTINHNQIFGDTLNEDKSRLTKSLCLLDLDPKKHYRYNYKEPVRPAVWDFIKQRSLKTGLEWKFLWYYLTPECGAKVVVPELPKGFVAGLLTEKDISAVNSSWPFHFDDSIKRLQCLHKYNIQMGIYTESGELAGFSLRYEFGALAVLHVNEPFRKRGLGTYLVKAMSKKIGECGEYTTSGIEEGNVASIGLFESIGFKKNGFLYYLEILPSNE
ncbi:unnamed protein product [Hermetia illucens]|uniref:N-acetyltransferase domain-containing protein n=1 Tax=Hermetia illucens TaxID=343691 RepID=A0A7R8YX48_HERIL|nr:uncharacterized protein LOC119654702 [Hermetia illucens]CAD7087512.1 unnamed protein product [Hermetia illucens]